MQRREVLKSLALATGGLFVNQNISAAENAEDKPKKLFTVAHITDVHIRQDLNAPKRFKDTLLHIVSKHKPDFFLNGGDSIFDASYNSVTRERALFLWGLWDECLSVLNNKYEIYSCIGNHDPWWKAPSESDEMYGIPYAVKRLKIPNRYYRIKKGNWHFIILDGNKKGISLDDEQFSWLENELQQIPDNEHVLLMSHYPVFGASILLQGGGHSDFKKLEELFYKHQKKVKIFLSGHNHVLDKAVYNTVSYCCNGAMSGHWWEPGGQDSAAPYFYKETPPGYAIVKLYSDGSVMNEYFAHGFNDNP